ncbi:Tat pathway signal protein [Actinopolymorpha pittospori]|uniref:Tat pathway signal protein n=1 Tax=Actinopolymorpha pittospori TaxID=648752 RepID=A0A927RA56_9ACTN|nr:Tat pathway signal protein [Actinopolymorpha pittospori]MBE1608597.1 hypothetical protein [Actinopolymorpha pittospori]
MFWGHFLYLGVNMWSDRPPKFVEELTFDYEVWEEVTAKMSADGLDLLVVDLGDGVRYESHPEIAVRNAWSPQRLREELARLRALGIEPIPKLNFSTAHDAWLREYGRMVSTPRYYEVCADLLAEVAELFDRPRFVHIGMDEETAHHQRTFDYSVVRQNDLWWHDLVFLAEQVERHGARPWIWSDYAWHHPDLFYERMPRRILQSNWYYGESFEPPAGGRPRVLEEAEGFLTYPDLEAHGYDQMPTGSTHSDLANFGRTVEYCTEHIDGSRLLGFLQVPWRRTVAEFRDIHLTAVDLVRETKEKYDDAKR